MKLGVLGDIHLFSLRVHPRRLISKRALGHANLALNRRKRFEHALLPAMLDHLRSLDTELVLMSGDVSTSSLEREFADLREVLAAASVATQETTEQTEGEQVAEAVESPAMPPAVLVPGNHDRYTYKARRTRRIETELADLMPDAFPHVRRLDSGGDSEGGPHAALQRGLEGGWKLLALDSAIPQAVLSRGKLGREQFAAALEVIEDAKPGEGLVVLCHYPCVVPAGTPSGWTHDLAEAKRLRWALNGCEARVLFVHGHVHKPWYVAGPKGLRPDFEILNAGSPCLKSGKFPRGQGFWELELDDDPGAGVTAIHHRPTAGDAVTGLTWAATRYENGRVVGDGR